MRRKGATHAPTPPDTASTKTITLSIGQIVTWPPSPRGDAQICDLRTKKVRLYYKTKNGKDRFALVPAAKIIVPQLLFEMNNPYDRANIVRSKTYKVTLT